MLGLRLTRRSHKVLLLTLWMLISTLDADTVKKEVSAAYLTDALSDLSYKDGRIAFGMWMQELSGREDININISYYDSSESILQDFRDSTVKLIGINPFFYLEDYQAYGTSASHIWAAQVGETLFEKMVLLVSTESSIDSLLALKGKRIIRAEDNLLGGLFLDAELLKDQHVLSDGFIKEMLITRKNSTAILKTYFGKADACVVPEVAYRLATEMNPSLSRKLHVLVESSKVFIPMLLLIHKDTDEGLYNAFHRNATTLDQTLRGQNILSLFKMRRLFVLSDEQLRPLQHYYSEFLALKQRYGIEDE